MENLFFIRSKTLPDQERVCKEKPEKNVRVKLRVQRLSLRRGREWLKQRQNRNRLRRRRDKTTEETPCEATRCKTRKTRARRKLGQLACRV